jgi:hypothetical protein
MQTLQPCMDHVQLIHYFIVVMNVVQAVAIAYVGARTYRKNREENGMPRYRRK